MTTTQEMIETTRSYLTASEIGVLDTLASAYTSGGTMLTFSASVDNISPGAVVSIDLEVFIVTAFDASAKTVTVIGGQAGSTAANHSSGALVRIAPEFTDFQILREINFDLADLSSPSNGLFAITDVTITYNNSISGYDLTSATAVIDILEVKYDESGSEKIWPVIPAQRWDLKRRSDTTDFASGFALVLYGAESGRTIRVAYSKPFVSLSAVGDVVETVSGLPATAIDIPPLGAARRLIQIKELQRNLMAAQRDSRRPVEVPAGALTGAARTLAEMRAERIAAEATRLRSDWPHRRH